MEMRVYIANLGKYNEGELMGAWFTPPISYEEVKEQIGLNEQYEEYAIHDYELPFEITEYCSIEEVNRLCELVEEIDSPEVKDNLQTVIDHFGFSGIGDLVEHLDDITVYGCASLEDLVLEFLDEGMFGEIPERLANYINYEAIARDLEVEGYYLELHSCVISYY